MTICGNCGGSFLPAEAKRIVGGEFYVFFYPLCGAGRTEPIPAQLSKHSWANEQFYNLPDRIGAHFERRTEFFRH